MIGINTYHLACAEGSALQCCSFMECSNYWNLAPNINWIFKINNHCNCLNGQVLLSFVFSCYNVSRFYYQFLLPVECYVRSRKPLICLEWVNSAVAFCIQSLLRESENASVSGWILKIDGKQWYCCYQRCVGQQPHWICQFTAGNDLFDCSEGYSPLEVSTA